MGSDSIWKLAGPALFSVAAVFLAVILLIIFRRFSSLSKSSGARPGNIDLVSLKKKGVLTPEELEQVGKAMLRQMQKQTEAEKRRQAIASADDLLLDPEVRRLEALATAAKTEAKRQPVQSAPTVTPAVVSPAMDTPLQGLAASEDYQSIELPLDVQQLLDNGLLSPEEADTIRRRIWQKQQAAQGQ